jgi:hypothetical protein
LFALVLLLRTGVDILIGGVAAGTIAYGVRQNTRCSRIFGGLSDGSRE